VSFFAELRRRNVLRAAGAYAAVAWLILQVAETLLPAFGFEDAVLRTVLVILAIGFLPAIAAAWAFELTASGIVREENVDRSSPQSRRMDRRLDRILVVILAIAVAYFAFDKFYLEAARDRDREKAALEAQPDAGSASERGLTTLAVLPFSAIGTGEESRLFALGVHDDLLTRLAKLDSLRVLSRTSVMKYQDTTRNLREVGAALGAGAILEGAVQSDGERIRINAQLIDATTDEHLWAETYDRELSTASIFEVQADIAGAIARSLQATMTEATSGTSPLPTQNMAAYRAFHRAMALRDQAPGAVTSAAYRDLLRRALELDPAFARPAAELVGSLAFGYFQDDNKTDAISEAEELIVQLQRVAPGSAEYLIAQSYYTYYVLKDYDLAHEVIVQAHALAPSDLRLLSLKGWIERRQGDFEARLATTQRQLTLDPENPRHIATAVMTLTQLHRYDAALALGRANVAEHPMLQWFLARLRVKEHGDLERMADDLSRLRREEPGITRPADLAMDYIAARRYDRAAEILLAAQADDVSSGMGALSISNDKLAWMQLYWLTGDQRGLAEMLPLARAEWAASERPGLMPLLGEAFLMVMAGEADQGRRAVRRWLRESDSDPADRAGYFYFACDILGMAGAAEEAVACLRAGLAEPSLVTPFVDPQLPFYDGIRDSPEFERLLRALST